MCCSIKTSFLSTVTDRSYHHVSHPLLKNATPVIQKHWTLLTRWDISLYHPQFAVSQSEALSTSLISCDVKSPTWYGYDVMLAWPNLYTVIPNRTFYDTLRGYIWLVWPRHGYFVLITLCHNTNRCSTKLAWHICRWRVPWTSRL